MGNIDRRKVQADEEAPVPPREISFQSSNRRRFSNDDDNNTLPSELSSLIPSTLAPNHQESNPSQTSSDISSKKAFRLAAFLAGISVAVLACIDVDYFFGAARSQLSTDLTDLKIERNMEVSDKKPKSNKKKKKKKKKQTLNDDGLVVAKSTHEHDDDVDEVTDNAQEIKSQAASATNLSDAKHSGEVLIPTPEKRCAYVVDTFEKQNKNLNQDFLREKYKVQSADSNVFYRATALLFWQDFGTGIWGKSQNKSIVLDDLVMLNDATYEDGTKMSPMSTWTWVTGDQHLSNFGAWRNRAENVVFSVNDFDEAAIYDFHIDVLRVAVSIVSHGFTNGLSQEQVRSSLEAFTYMYVKTVINYVGNDRALVYELTSQTSTGVLRDFLDDVEKRRSKNAQLEKFTEPAQNGRRRFSRDDKTRLVDVPTEIDDKIRAAFTSTTYGATLVKTGWKVRDWSDDFFEIVDIARRLGSGVGSYGVDRFYVLLKGTDQLLDGGMGMDDSHVILDVKFEPVSAVTRTILQDADASAWYATMFQSEADRVRQAQVQLTSYTDPYVGYIYIDGDSYNVRQRSPYKRSFNIDNIHDHRVYEEYIEQIAKITATAHTRGSVSKSPGQFKHNIKRLLAGDRNRSRWSNVSVLFRIYEIW